MYCVVHVAIKTLFSFFTFILHTHTRVRAHTHIHTDTYTHRHTHTYTHTHTHTYTHTEVKILDFFGKMAKSNTRANNTALVHEIY